MPNEMQKMIAKGEVGELFSVHGEYVQDWLMYDTDYSWRLEKGQVGKTRAIADIGSHWMDLAEFVTGEKIKRVNAAFRTGSVLCHDFVGFIPVSDPQVI